MNKTTFFLKGVVLQKNKKWVVAIEKRLKTTDLEHHVIGSFLYFNFKASCEHFITVLFL
jgi:hypothetical protein